MKRIRMIAVSFLVAAGITAGAVLSKLLTASPRPQEVDPQEAADLAALAKVGPIDTHAHVFVDSAVYYQMMKDLNLHIVDICVVGRANLPPSQSAEAQFKRAMTVHHGSNGRAGVCTTFNPYSFREKNFDEDAIKQLNGDFAAGAIAVKIWKNMGMDLKFPSGKYVMPDDPVFEPIYKDIVAHDKTMIAHLAEPDSCWMSFEQMGPHNPDYNYYKHNPYWHMYGKPGAPSKADILKARDHLLEMNPKLRVVGAHLGSMETDVDEIAKRFDRYPNFNVDTAARIVYLMKQPREKVRAFLIKYQDRICYGTDGGIRQPKGVDEIIKHWKYQYALSWKYFATDETFEYRGVKTQGLKLPMSVVRKIYHGNAARLFPGLIQ
ncbi:MAG TPA: amidohydrolase family protein [Terriglobia bacterium]|nr:amidohydrolase family protein [Terriglobia bacterium]